mgnify:CR=1 FL=1
MTKVQTDRLLGFFGATSKFAKRLLAFAGPPACEAPTGVSAIRAISAVAHADVASMRLVDSLRDPAVPPSERDDLVVKAVTLAATLDERYKPPADVLSTMDELYGFHLQVVGPLYFTEWSYNPSEVAVLHALHLRHRQAARDLITSIYHDAPLSRYVVGAIENAHLLEPE